MAQDRSAGPLVRFLVAQRWFGGKARSLRGARIVDTARCASATDARLVVVEVRYASGPSERYLLPLVCARIRPDRPPDGGPPPRPVMTATSDGRRAIACRDGVDHRDVQACLLGTIARGARIRTRLGSIVGEPGPALSRFLARHSEADLLGDCRIVGAEQSNTSLRCGEAFVLKIFRRLQPGIHPEVEISRFLSETVGRASVPPFGGALEYRRRGRRPVALGVLQGFVPNRGDGWRYALNLVGHSLDRRRPAWPARSVSDDAVSPFTVARTGTSRLVRRLVGADAIDMAVLLARRTAELHEALAGDRADPAFAPAPCTLTYQRALARDMTARAADTYRLLRRSLSRLRPAVQTEAAAILRVRHASLSRIRRLGVGRFTSLRIRCHGDYHLGQVLYTGHDFIVIDFEGEPTKPLAARRAKHPALRDVAGMIRSLHYAAYAGVFDRQERGRHVPALWSRARVWYAVTAGVFLRAYLDTLGSSPLLPQDPAETLFWLETFLLDKALYEASYELNNRPDWLAIPLAGIRDIIRERASGADARPAQTAP